MSLQGPSNAVQLELEREPILCFPYYYWLQLRTYILRCTTEINGFGLIRQTPEDNLTFVVEDIFILDQRATASSVETDQQALMRKMHELTQDGKSELLRLQWHSHVHMPAYFSATDQANIDRVPGTWLVSLVLNQHNQLEARLDVYKPFRGWAPVRVKVWLPEIPEVTARVDEDIKKLVRRKGLPGIKAGLRELSGHGLMLDGTEVEVDCDHS
jgi:proteasome lid subunit RPN8/RPN11